MRREAVRVQGKEGVCCQLGINPAQLEAFWFANFRRMVGMGRGTGRAQAEWKGGRIFHKFM